MIASTSLSSKGRFKCWLIAGLEPEATIKKYLFVRTEGNRRVQRSVKHYSLQAIIAVKHLKDVKSADGRRSSVEASSLPRLRREIGLWLLVNPVYSSLPSTTG